MIRESEDFRYLQATESKNAAQSNLLRSWLMKTPNVRDWENQKSPVRDDIGHRIADEESVDIHGTSWVHGLIPLGHGRVSILNEEDAVKEEKRLAAVQSQNLGRGCIGKWLQRPSQETLSRFSPKQIQSWVIPLR